MSARREATSGGRQHLTRLCY